MMEHFLALNASSNSTNSTIELQCSDIIHNETLWQYNADLRCQLVSNSKACFFNDGHIEYIYGMYCVFRNVVPLGVTLMFLWLIMMLIGLATTADAFFGPCLIVMADTLHLSQNVAGVTLLALGNGAPDIFSAISSITTLKDGDAGLAFGALLGAGMFVTSVTAGAIAIVKPFTAMSRPLLKDIVFYMFTIFWAFVIMFKQEITLVDSVGFIVLYASYVSITVLSRALYSKGIGAGSKDQPAAEQQQAEDAEAGVDGSNGTGSEAGSTATVLKMETIRRLRTDTDIRTNLTDVYADNLAFSRDSTAPAVPVAAAPSGTAGSSSRSSRNSSFRQGGSDTSAAGYDTSLEFPGGLGRVGENGVESGQEVKKPRSRRFQALDIRSSPKTSQASQSGSRKHSARNDEPMKRVSRVQKISRAHSTQASPKVSTSVAVSGAGDEGFVSGGSRKPSAAPRKISTSSFTGVERRANYLTRWMLVHGNLENVERRNRSVSQSSGHSGGGGGGDAQGTRPRSRSSSLTRQQQKRETESARSSMRQKFKVSGGLGSMDVYDTLDQPEQRTRSSSQPARPEEEKGTRPRMRSNSASRMSEQDGASDEQAGAPGRQGFKVSGGLGMDAASGYFQRRAKELQARKDSSERQKRRLHLQSLQKRLEDLQSEEDDIHQRHLYRIESVDEALDDDTVDYLNQLNQQRQAEQKRLDKIKEREERERAASREIEESGADAGADAEANESPKKEDPAEAEDDPSPFKEFLYSLVPIDLGEFPEMTWYNKVYEIIKAPILFLLLLTTPSVDYDQPLNGWSRILNSIHCALAPVFISLAVKGYQWSIPMGGDRLFPVVPIIMGVGMILGIVVFCTSYHFEPPRYHAAFAFVGFLTALVWIYTFANEVVNILESVGVIFKISSTILGLTVLAWANSIGDVISNTVLARQNFPRIAISACFGGPLFNLLLGVGIPFTIKLLSQESKPMQIQVTVVQLVLVVSVTISLIISMLYLTIFRFKLGRVYGLILIVLYVAFLVVALLAETNVLPLLPSK